MEGNILGSPQFQKNIKEVKVQMLQFHRVSAMPWRFEILLKSIKLGSLVKVVWSPLPLQKAPITTIKVCPCRRHSDLRVLPGEFSRRQQQWKHTGETTHGKEESANTFRHFAPAACLTINQSYLCSCFLLHHRGKHISETKLFRNRDLNWPSLTSL